MNLDELKANLDKQLELGLVSGSLLLSKMRLLDEASRRSAAYCDHRYAPFYYHLGKFIRPESMIEFGFNLGLLSGSFLKSCKTVRDFLAFQPKKEGYYSPKLGRANVRDNYKNRLSVYVGSIHDEEFMAKISPNSWDLVILNDETVYDKHLEYLDFVWPYVSEGGLIVAEYIERHIPAKDAFFGFCDSKNRSPLVFDTRYGTGIVEK